MDDVKNDDAPSSGAYLDRVGDYVRQPRNGFLECAVHSASPAGAVNAKFCASLADRYCNLSGRFGILPRDIRHGTLQIVQRRA